MLAQLLFVMLMPGILLDLPGSYLALKVIELFDGQTIQEFDAPFDLEGGLQEHLVFILLRAFERNGIRDTPVGGNRRARENRASLARIVAHGDDEIEMNVGKFVPRLTLSASASILKFSRRIFRTRGWISPVGASPPL
jgi:hypothetical protein